MNETLLDSTTNLNTAATKVILITGGAQRIGAEIVRYLHARGNQIILHYRNSRQQAAQLAEQLTHQRADSVRLIQADLRKPTELKQLIEQAITCWQGLDVLINNASSFYPTPIGTVDNNSWDELLETNLKSPFFLAQAAAPWLKQRHGCIVNLLDIHAQRPLENHPVYSIAKSGLQAMTYALAKELGPEIRVNGVAPGAILWPEKPMSNADKQEILNKITLQRIGTPADIAKTVNFLIHDADYITGQVLTVDGGRTLYS